MALRLDKEQLRSELEPLLEDTGFRSGVEHPASDAFLLKTRVRLKDVGHQHTARVWLPV